MTSKTAFYDAVNRTWEQRDRAQAKYMANKPTKRDELKLMHILEGGSQLELDDGSKWKIAHYFKKEVFEYWRHGDRVTIREISDDPSYPFTIYNTEESLEVSAARIDGPHEKA